MIKGYIYRPFMSDLNIKYYPKISDYLKAMNLLDKQKHPDFHILKFEDHLDVIPMEMDPYKIGIFMLTLNINYTLDLSVGDITYELKDETITVNSPGQIISVKGIEPNEEGIGYMILFEPEFLNFLNTTYDIYRIFPYFNINSSPVYHFEIDQTDPSRILIEKIYDEFKDLNPDSLEIIRSYLTIFLYEGKKILDSNTISSYAASRFEEVTFLYEQLIKKTDNKRQSLEYYSDLLNLSTVYLSECVKKATGKTAKQVLSEYILLESKALLRNSNQTIANIAFQIGFEDQSNFIKFFKKEVGCTPRQFRSNPSF